jgi:hypothetical protein
MLVTVEGNNFASKFDKKNFLAFVKQPPRTPSTSMLIFSWAALPSRLCAAEISQVGIHRLTSKLNLGGVGGAGHLCSRLFD